METSDLLNPETLTTQAAASYGLRVPTAVYVCVVLYFSGHSYWYFSVNTYLFHGNSFMCLQSLGGTLEALLALKATSKDHLSEHMRRPDSASKIFGAFDSVRCEPHVC
jgi:hypothetical protein